MTKFEFLGDLSRLIADLPEEDREQAMEYYEDYFADAGPEMEQEIIKDFISPAYIAEQLREASAQRQRQPLTLEDEVEEPMPGEKPAVFSRKSAAMAKKNAAAAISYGSGQPAPSTPPAGSAQPTSQPNPAVQQNTTANPATTPQVTSTPSTSPQQPTAASAPSVTAPTTPAASTAPGMATAATPTTPTTASQDIPVSAAASVSPEAEASKVAMRNPIFQDSSENTEEEKEALELKKKTKVDIKSINTSVSKVDKAQAKAARKMTAEEKAQLAEQYSSSKKTIILVVLIVTCPIWLGIAGLGVAIALLMLGLAIGLVVLGVGGVAASVVALLLTILSLLTAQIPNSVFALGGTLFLFSAGIGLCYADFKLCTRAIPGAYFSIVVLANNIKATLGRLAMK